jgi:molybdopterin-guanine dinucleotide biosynthesis protein A
VKIDRAKVTGVVLAGGRARRMGGEDKGLIPFKGRPLAAYAVEALGTVAGQILVNANRNQAAYAGLGHPVIADPTNRFDGPLAGLLSAMNSADTPYILTVPCDCPFMTGELLQRLITAFSGAGAEIAVARDAERLHPVFLCVRRDLADSLEHYLRSGQRKIDTWLGLHRQVFADYSDQPEVFINVNTPEELAALERRS